MAGQAIPQFSLSHRGRPIKFTPEVRQKLLQAIRLGNHITTACEFAGVSLSTFRTWTVQGERFSLMDDVSDLDDVELDYLAFYEAMRQAQAAAEMTAVAHWRAQMPADWKASRDFLARRHPEKWGAKVEINVTHMDEEILSLLSEETSISEVIEARSQAALPASLVFDQDGDEDEDEG